MVRPLTEINSKALLEWESSNELKIYFSLLMKEERQNFSIIIIIIIIIIFYKLRTEVLHQNNVRHRLGLHGAII